MRGKNLIGNNERIRMIQMLRHTIPKAKKFFSGANRITADAASAITTT